jgi:hypothetical protein
MSIRFTSFSEFWPFYVCEHSKARTRTLHFIGTSTIFPLLIATIFYDYYLVFLIPVCAYFFAWYSHFFVEKNKPATFIYPLWSLLGDFKMFWLMCKWKMQEELKRCEKMELERSVQDVSFNADVDRM